MRAGCRAPWVPGRPAEGVQGTLARKRTVYMAVQVGAGGLARAARLIVESGLTLGVRGLEGSTVLCVCKPWRYLPADWAKRCPWSAPRANPNWD